MKATLVKERGYYDLYRIDKNGKKVIFASTEDYKQKLSKQNCDEIFGVVDVDKLIKEADTSHLSNWTSDSHEIMFDEGFKMGFAKKAELDKDKLFTLDDMKRACSLIFLALGDGGDITTDEVIESLQKPTEIDVEIEMEYIGECNGNNDNGCFQNSPGHDCGCFKREPKLDENGCLILKRK